MVIHLNGHIHLRYYDDTVIYVGLMTEIQLFQFELISKIELSKFELILCTFFIKTLFLHC